MTYRFFHAPIYAFFSADFYRAVAHSWRGFGFGVLFLVVAVAAVIPAVQMQKSFSDWVGNGSKQFTSQVPPIAIEGGVLSVDAPMPHIIDSEGEQIVVDTRYDADEVAVAFPDASIVVGHSGVIYGEGSTEAQTLSFAELDDFAFDGDDLEAGLAAVEPLALPVLSVMFVLGSFAAHIMQALLYAILGLVVAPALKAKLDYGQLVRLASVALIPSILIDTAVGNVPVLGDLGSTLSVPLALGYLAFAIRSASEEDESVSRPGATAY